MEATVRTPRMLRFGVFEVDLQLAEVRKHGTRIRLQEQPFQILVFLLEHPGELVSRDQLRHKLWPDDIYVDFDHNLNKAMNKLRAALGDSADNPRFIETLHRKGYRFIAPVSAIPDSAAMTTEEATHVSPASAARTAEQVTERETGPSAILYPGAPLRPLLWGAISLAGIFLVCSAVLLYKYQHSHSTAGNPAAPVNAAVPINAAVPVRPRRSVAVLGFKNLSGRPGEAWLSTALSDWLTTDLSAGDQLRTVSSESVARMETELSLSGMDSLEKDSLQKIGKNLGTNYAVTGAYAVIDSDSQGQVRLDLRLQDTQTGETVAAVSETGTESHLFNLVSRAGESLRAKLGIQAVTREEATEVAVALPENHDAARLYSEGLERLRVFDALAAQDLLKKSISIEPQYSLSHAALATAWAELGYDDKAKLEAKDAFELSAALARPERLLVEGRYHEMSKDWEGAINIYRALFEFFPDSLDYGLALADAQVNDGKGKEALATIETLRRLPAPLSEDPRLDLADSRAAESLGDFKHDLSSSMQAGQKARVIGASLLLAQALADECWAYVNLGQPDEAVAAAEESKQLFATAGDRRGAGLAANMIGITLENKGDAAGAKQMYGEALAIYRQLGNKQGVAGELDNMADILMALGDLNGSLRTYKESLATYQEIGHEDGIALVKGGLGVLLLAMGDHSEAKKNFEESLEICLRLGDKSKAAFDMEGLGRTLRAEGDSAGAQKYEAQALTIFQEIGDRSSVAQTQLVMADLMIDENNASPAVNQARKAAQEFRKEKEADGEAVANAILARGLLAEAKVADAQNAIHEADSALSRGHRMETALLVAITSARVRAALGNASDEKQAANMMESVLAQSKQAGFVPFEFEARLSLAELELRSKGNAAGRVQMEELEKGARAQDFGLIARQASAILQQTHSKI